MTNLPLNTVIAELRAAWSRAQLGACALALRGADALRNEREWLRELPLWSSPTLRTLGIATGALAILFTLVCGGLWWRLSSGPISLDLATPWITAALEDRFGGKHHVEIGGTVLERDEDGRAALRLHDIVVRDANGVLVAKAPKAEIGITLTSLLIGHVTPERLSLIGAEMAVRIERDGRMILFAAGGQEPTVTASSDPGLLLPATGQGQITAAQAAPLPDNRTGAFEPTLFGAVLSWLKDLDAVGLDGRDLIEIGLRNGTVTVEDRRNGKALTFANIDMSLTRPKGGGAALAVTSVGTDGPWSLNATVTPRAEGRRFIETIVRDISPKDILLALRLDVGDVQTDVPLSGVVRAQIDRDGMPEQLEGRIIAGAGYIGDIEDPSYRVLIDEAQFNLHWDNVKHELQVPIEIHSGDNHFTIGARIVPPRDGGAVWNIGVEQGDAVLAAPPGAKEAPLKLDRVLVQASIDAKRRKIDVSEFKLLGPVGGMMLTGSLDLGRADPWLQLGITGTRMDTATFKRLWPVFVSPKVRNWVVAHIHAGSVEKASVGVNSSIAALTPSGPVLTPDALAIDIVGKSAAVEPVDGLPTIRDTDMNVHVTGRTALISFGRGTAELPSGRKLTVAGGTFEVPDTAPKAPATRTQFRVEGAVESVSELVSMDAMRDAAAMPFDPAAAHGAVAAKVTLNLPLKKDLRRESVDYLVEADVTGFSADHFIRGLKAEAATLKVNATSEALQIKGDMKIAGTPATVDFRRARGEPDAEVRIQTTLDDAARNRMGLDAGDTINGSMPVKISGRVKMTEREGRLSIDADLTHAKVTELLPGWNKPAGRAARLAFTLVDKGATTKLDDFVLEGAGASVRGSVEVDSNFEVVHASFPSFALSDGDKTSLRADRTNDGVLKVVMRGDLYDGRGFVKNTVSGEKPDKRSKNSTDLDLDVKVGAVTGHHGEALRGIDLRLTRRNGQIRTLAMNGKIGSTARVSASLRPRGNGRQVVVLESSDAGALFRFTDTYARVFGGNVSIAMDAPTADGAAQEGLINVHDFTVRGEPALESVASSGSAPPSYDRTGRARPSTGSGVSFSRMRVEFTRSPGRFTVRDGVVWGPSVGATMDGYLDYSRDEVRLRGTFVPAYALNNMFGRLPIVGLFLGGGSNEGLLGITYQVVGSPQRPMLQVNPMSAVAPGFLRKLFEFRGGNEEQSLQMPDVTR